MSHLTGKQNGTNCHAFGGSLLSSFVNRVNKSSVRCEGRVGGGFFCLAVTRVT